MFLLELFIAAQGLAGHWAVKAVELALDVRFEDRMHSGGHRLSLELAGASPGVKEATMRCTITLRRLVKEAIRPFP